MLMCIYHTYTPYILYSSSAYIIHIHRIGSLANPKPRFVVDRNTIGEALPLGSQKVAVLNDDDFTQMKECWAVEYKAFRKVYEAYTAYANKERQANNSSNHRRVRRRINPMNDWEPHARLNFSAKQLAMCKISPVVKVHTFYV